MAGYLKYLCFSLDFLSVQKKRHGLVKQIHPNLYISGNILGALIDWKGVFPIKGTK
jgi:hypothetical protein